MTRDIKERAKHPIEATRPLSRKLSDHDPRPQIERPSRVQRSKPYFADDEYLVTALVPSETACLASSPGRMSRTEVWISREEMVDFLL